jgi:YidC/Oxa1 family membrane protein insertase
MFTTIFYTPLFNALIWLYNIIPGDNMGLAILALTLIIRVILYPIFTWQIRSQKAMQEMQTDIKRIQEQYKNDRTRQSQEMMKLYKEKKTNPFSSCLPLLIQLPIWFALYRSFAQGLSSQGFERLYSFVANPGTINTNFFGIIDLSERSIVLAVTAGLIQFWQAKKMMSKLPPKEVRKDKGAVDEDFSAIMSKQMTYVMPAVMVFLGISWPSGLMLYIAFSTLLSIAQQYVIERRSPTGLPSVTVTNK